jgi:rhamnosyltransferase subunit B
MGTAMGSTTHRAMSSASGQQGQDVGRKRRIVFAAMGTLGDLHPCLAIGNALRARGYAVTIATHTGHRMRVDASALGFAPLRPDLPRLGPQLHAQMFHPRRGAEVTIRQIIAPAIRDSYADVVAAADGADLLVATPTAFAVRIAAEKLAVPWASIDFAASVFASAYEPPPLPRLRFLTPLRPFGLAYGRAVRAAIAVGTRSWVKPIRSLRRELGLPPGPNPLLNMSSPDLSLATFSPVLARPQPDWPKSARITGFPYYDRDDFGRETSPALADFLDAGPPPIVVTLGSGAVNAAWAGALFAASIDAAHLLGRRLLLLIGSEPSTRAALPEPLPTGVAALAYAPHAHVFPRAAAIVHQGGTGTLAQAMRAGRPMLVTPFVLDQYDNAARAVRLGVARTLPPGRFNAWRLAAALGELLADPKIAARAEAVGRVVRMEDGATVAADAIEGLLAARSLGRA